MKLNLNIECDTLDELRSVTTALATRGDAPVTTTETVVTPAPTPNAPVADVKSETAPTPNAPVADVKSETAPTVDSIGMPYNEDIHATPASFKTDGSWKVKKGQAENAKAAVAAFKAAGGAVTPPVVETPAAPAPTGMPGAKAAPTGMPGATVAPVALADVMAKWTGMMDSGKLTEERATAICVEATGAQEGHYPIFETNETARAKLNELLDAEVAA